MAIYIPNVDQAAKMIVLSFQQENYDRLREIQEYLSNQEVAARIAGTAGEFHNASVMLTRVGFYDYAYALLNVAKTRYPRDTDILADMLLYGLKCRTREELLPIYHSLQAINDKRLWTWRAYHFSFDFLMEELRYAIDPEVEKKISSEIERIITDFKDNSQYLDDQSDREKAYMIEYEYYRFKRDNESALKALDDATKELPDKCAQCALKYADYLFECGRYQDVIPYAEKAVGVKEDQPSISLGYANYILAMSKEKMLRNSGGALTAERVKPVFSAYYAAVINMEEHRTNLLDSIKKQVKALEYESGVQSGISFIEETDDNEALASLEELLRHFKK